jgi:hypothetical protein
MGCYSCALQNERAREARKANRLHWVRRIATTFLLIAISIAVGLAIFGLSKKSFATSEQVHTGPIAERASVDSQRGGTR